MHRNTISAQFMAEAVGTFILILFGNGAIAVSVWTGAYDLWGVALMWGLGVALGVYASGSVSGGHLNPAVTIAQAAFNDDFEWGKVLPYIGAQLLGAFLATAAIHLAFAGVLGAFEAAEGLTRGGAGSHLSAMVYTTYAPNPAIIGTSEAALNQVPLWRWFANEVIITGVLVFGIFFLIESRNDQRPAANLGPVLIGLLVAALVAYAAPVSMAALNPARDLGPRNYTAQAGWGPLAYPRPRGGYWIPTTAANIGGLIGGAFYTFIYDPVFNEEGQVSTTSEAVPTK
ncbi:MAG: MIP/aquaporin family protein [Anaerolineae bacterium]